MRRECWLFRKGRMMMKMVSGRSKVFCFESVGCVSKST
jgi:hypothetical protein